MKTSETQSAKQDARIQQCEDTLEKQAATLKEMKKSYADVEERISKMVSKLEETKTLLAQALGQLDEREEAMQIRTQTSTATLLAEAFGRVEARDDAMQKSIIDIEKRLVSVEANDCDDEDGDE